MSAARAKAALHDCKTARVGRAGVRRSSVVRPLPPPLLSAGGIEGGNPTILYMNMQEVKKRTAA